MPGLFGRTGISGGGASPYYPVGLDCVLYHAYWDQTAVDHSSYGNDGIVFQAAFGIYGLTFDGINDYVDIPINGSLNIGTLDFAHFFWVNFSTAPQFATIALDAMFGSPAEGYRGEHVAFRNISPAAPPQIFTGTPEVESPDGVPYYKIPQWQPVGFNAGSWHLIGYEVDRDVGGHISVDGIIILGPLGNTTTIDLTFSTNIRIGLDPAHGQGQFTGIMGETLWFKAFGTYSGKSRLDLYNATKSRYGL